jgi:hypothetical protein
MKRAHAVLFVAALAVLSLALHFVFGWYAAIDEAAAQGESAAWGEYLLQWGRDTFENLQSEFWQLAVQFAILAGLLGWLNVHAHEEDQEQIKAELEEIKSILAEHRSDIEAPHPPAATNGHARQREQQVA